MTQMTPPGWYPDPGQTSDGPPTERWWDGTAWTEQTRVLGASGAWGPPTAPSWPVAPPTSKRRKAIRAAIGTAVALAVLGGLAGGVYALTLDDDGGDDRTAPAPTASSAAPEGTQSPDGAQPPGGGPEDAVPSTPDGSGGPGGRDGGGPSGPGVPEQGAPPLEKGYATDLASGISLPVPQGWTGQSSPIGAQVTTGPYKCPGDAKNMCARAGANSGPAKAFKRNQSSAEAIAKADIKEAAEEAYGKSSYGGITSHSEVAARSATVAGGKGYLVRWKVITEKGDDGYVQTLAFPSPRDKGQFVVVRFGFDVNDKAPELSVMDDITKGIKKAPKGSGNGRPA
ncbi:DUF2510 domain-containing protein [Streptomyces sp. NPDC058171]